MLRLALLLAALVGLAGPAGGADEAALLTLRQAQALSVPAPTLAPPDGGHYVPQALPDDWTGPSGPGEQVRWYRLDFDPPPVPAATLLAVYLPRVCSNLEVHLNGQLLYRGGRLREPVTRNCYRSQLISLPAGLLTASGNRLDIQVVGFALPRVSGRQRAGGLSEVIVGPHPLLADRHERQVFWNVTLAQIIAATLVMVGVVMLALAWVRRAGYLFYFGVVAIGWAMLSSRVWWRDIPLAHGTLELLSCIAFVPLSVCALLFLLRYCGVANRKLDLALWSQCLLLPALLLALGPERLFTGAAICYSLLALEVFVTIGYFLAHAWRTRREEFWLLGSILGLVAVVVAIEVGIQDRVFDLPHVHVIHFAIPVLFCALAFRLVQTFAQALTTAEAARQQLEQRVHEISAEIERNFSHLAEVRVEQVAEKERKRIAADLHDDLGAKLLTIVHTSTDERISTLAREALEEMRLSVRGIAGKPVQLTDALADWRAETVSRLGDAGIEIEWQSSEPATPRTLAARSYVQTTRVLREATSNLIKHSGASRAVVQVKVDEEFQLVIRDNGRGIPLELDGRLDRGHGMASMKQRAKQMQGQCLVESGPGYGTVIRLTLPL
ncbi:ATP-binding protein [uncultured Methylibium sp.]|uniref:sensor histidine kinase n=1 Tax=uncultured Methylibium sp. TaxID=381093 RepID=UPI0025DB13A0|nr:ATP-binding protein [uncultured Methylibium sp.]